jgi:3D (Asp-Asp-Asp) domain-containing protein
MQSSATALCALAASLGTGAAPAGAAAVAPSGGAGIGNPAPAKTPGAAQPPGRRGTWLTGVLVTQYWPAPESWFIGALVNAPGLTAEHRIDWLYSATGVSMQGEGIGLDGQMYHLASFGIGGWVTASGAATSAADGFAAGPPYWRAGAFWRNPSGGVTFPLSLGGWSAGAGRRYVPLRGVTFAPGPSLPLRYWQSIAVDPSVIALGSRVYIPAYRHDGHGGWFTAQDTGGAIAGRHVDVFRSPPASPGELSGSLAHQRVFVIPPRG